MEKTINVVIVEDVKDIRESLRALVGGMHGFACTGTYATAEAAIADLQNVLPDVVLMDINLPGINGIEAVKILKARDQSISFLMCTVFEDVESIFLALRAGASGYILKSSSPIKILDAIKEVAHGGAPMSASIAKKVITFFHETPKEVNNKQDLLTEREQEVLLLLSQGLLYKEAASKLNLSVETIRSHCRKIYEKLHVSTKTEAINLFYGKK